MTVSDRNQTAVEAPARRSYHHGRLKEALLEAARALIEQRGPQGFSLTEAARLVGVTPAAPYRHFPDREALIGEVTRRGFDLFNERLAEAWDNGQPDAMTAFSRMGRAYLDFARNEPGYYRCMFMRTLGPDVHDPPVVGDSPSASRQSFAMFTEATAAAMRTEWSGEFDPVLLALKIWALSHGVATLMLGGYLPPSGPADAYNLLDSGVGALMAGVMNP